MYNEIVESPTINTDVCCPLFISDHWNNVLHNWKERLFLKHSIPEVFHVPLPGSYAKAITRMWKKAEAAGAAPDRQDFLLLAHDPTPFKAELYMAVTKEIPGEEVVKLTGEFFSKVYDASYSDVPKCLRKTDQLLAAKSMAAKKYYIYFPYCPECSKKYGHNYVVVVAEVSKL